MQIISRAALIALIALMLCGCATHSPQRGISLGLTYNNYRTGVKVVIKQAITDSGNSVAHAGVLSESTNPLSGATLTSTIPQRELPEWIEFTWTEFDPSTHDVRFTREQLLAMPVKKARVTIRGRVPQDVMDEVRNSPLDPTSSNLRLKSLQYYLHWTIDGVKLRWRVYQRCCTVLHEGGDTIR